MTRPPFVTLEEAARMIRGCVTHKYSVEVAERHNPPMVLVFVDGHLYAMGNTVASMLAAAKNRFDRERPKP